MPKMFMPELSPAEKAELEYWMAICETDICELTPKEKNRAHYLAERDTVSQWGKMLGRKP